MKVTKEITTPSIVIAHFLNEEAVLERGGRQIHYQVTVYPSTEERSQLSTTEDYIRFGGVRGDEITGWQPCSNIVIDEVLFEYESMKAVPFTENVQVQGKTPDVERKRAVNE